MSVISVRFFVKNSFILEINKDPVDFGVFRWIEELASHAEGREEGELIYTSVQAQAVQLVDLLLDVNFSSEGSEDTRLEVDGQKDH